jgi:hypothetical protein
VPPTNVSGHGRPALYQDDIENLIMFSNAFQKVIKPSGIEFIETAKDE